MNQINSENEIEKGINVEEEVEKPKIGMIYDITAELFQFNKLRAKLMGFEIIKRPSRKDDEGVLEFMSFNCSRNDKLICK